jgi:hypothetical protein
MVHYIVDDLDALLDRFKRVGVALHGTYDLDGNKIEFWQPSSAKP